MLPKTSFICHYALPAANGHGQSPRAHRAAKRRRPLTQHATFLVLAARSPAEPHAQQAICSALAGVSGLAKNVAMRDLDARFSCTLLDSLGRGEDSVVEVVDETVGFRYFDARDLLGFVDGTANPVGAALPASVLVEESDVLPVKDGGNEDASDTDFAAASAAVGGSYVVVQKYVHDMARWNALSTEQQESVIGRTKLANEELDDATALAQKAHKTLTTIVDEQTGEEHGILRDNMPFGSPGAEQFGTYFIGYSRRLWVVEKMLERMFIGVPHGMHDRILDYSMALTGTTFFAPSAGFLESLDVHG
ncbi:deferrochelatase/peroxidase YfeX [Apiospora hydei]|uniref:Deferrochelatase/peroxidase YfeX n=1 Tax=Apiospora hydei TaxID=1337664 RepID=A0ABR1V4C7_9PEZI